MWLVDTCPSHRPVICSRSCVNISRMIVIVIPSTGRAVLLESVDGVGDEGGGVGVDDDEVSERDGSGDDSEDEIIEGVTSEEGDEGSDGHPGDGGGMSNSSSSEPKRLRSSE